MSFGTDMEQYVAQSLRGRGAKCKVDTKTLGATDVAAVWPTGRGWRIQVKSTSRPGSAPPWPSNEEIRRLKMAATKTKQTAAVAQVFQDGTIEFRSARNRKIIHPPDTRKGKWSYNFNRSVWPKMAQQSQKTYGGIQ